MSTQMPASSPRSKTAEPPRYTRAETTLLIQNILLVASAYFVVVAVPVAITVTDGRIRDSGVRWFALFVMTLAILMVPTVLMVIHVVQAIRWFIQRDTLLATIAAQRRFNRIAMWMKLALVPFYVVNVAFCFVLPLATLGAGAVVWPFSAALCFVLLIGTSVMSWSALGTQKSRGLLTWGQMVWRVILQCLYVVDVATIGFIAHRLNTNLTEIRPWKPAFKVFLGVVLGLIALAIAAFCVWIAQPSR